MKTLIFILLVIAISIISNYACYSAKDTLPPNPTFSMCPCCGEIWGELVEDLPKDSTRSNMGSIIFDSVKSNNFRFTYEDFIPGEDSYTHWHAWVYDLSKDARLAVTFSDYAGNDTTIQVEYNAIKIEVRPDLDFGVLPVGDSKDMNTWIVNESSKAVVVIDSITLKSYYYQGFKVLKPELPINLQPHDSIPIKIKFTASENGEFKDSIGVRDTCWSLRFKSQLKAIVGSPRIDVGNYNFGKVLIRQAASTTIDIRNEGNADLIITKCIMPKNKDVFVADVGNLIYQVPLIIAPHSNYYFDVTFRPIEPIQYIDTMVFISNTEKINSPDSIVELYGVGEAVGVSENNYNNEINISPNPADDFLSINFQDLNFILNYVKLFDSFGNVVYENRNIIESNLKINTRELVSGMYFLQVGNVGMRKVLVVH